MLEIGCGRGENAAACGPGYLGVDADESALQAARRRHTDRTFQHWDGTTSVPGGPYHTVLMCLVLHELGSMREQVLEQALSLAGERLVVLDYDPAVRGWLRARESLLEMGKLGPYLSFDLLTFVTRRGWRLAHSEGIDDLYRWWEFVPAAGGPTPTRGLG